MKDQKTYKIVVSLLIDKILLIRKVSTSTASMATKYTVAPGSHPLSVFVFSQETASSAVEDSAVYARKYFTSKVILQISLYMYCTYFGIYIYFVT